MGKRLCDGEMEAESPINICIGEVEGSAKQGLIQVLKMGMAHFP